MNMRQLHIFFNQAKNMTCDCLFTFVFFPILTSIYLFCAENCSEHQNKTIFGTNQINSGKNGENTKLNKQLAAMFWRN